ncbi:MAG: hypothetical protein RLP15_00140 [Cryomorphaceae bacterium]
MKRLLFSSALAILLCAASCDGESEAPSTAPTANSKDDKEVETPTASAATPSAKKSVAPASNTSSNAIIDDSALTVPSEAPHHGTPDDARLDSLKNSYPSKK